MTLRKLADNDAITAEAPERVCITPPVGNREIMDSAERLSILESRVRRYLEERYAPGFTIQTHREFMPCHLRFKVRNPDGDPGPTLILPEEFVDHGDEIERELDARDVMGVMASAGKGIVVVPKVGPPVVEPKQPL